MIKAGLKHKGFAIIDVISPCVTFNNHKGSTKSYQHTYKYYHKAVHADFIPPSEEIMAAYDEGSTMDVELHDGGHIRLRKLDEAYDPKDRIGAISKVMESQMSDEILTGLLYINEDGQDMATQNRLEERPLNEIPYEELNPGAAKLRDLQGAFR